MNKEYVLIKIFNGRNTIFNYRFILRENKFDFIKKAYGKSYYQIEFLKTEKSSIEKWKEFCNQNKLKIQIVDYNHIRNNIYRNTFFERKKTILKKYYFCTYCGKIIKKENSTIDHIFPIDRISQNKFYQKVISIINIVNINDYKNLTISCKSCNSKKGTKMGTWIIKGFLGKSNFLWFIRWIVRMIILVLIIKMVILII